MGFGDSVKNPDCPSASRCGLMMERLRTKRSPALFRSPRIAENEDAG
jgi:hypothetical protein